MVWEYVAPVGLAFARGLVGWLMNSLEDGEIQRADWLKLGKNLILLLGVGFGLATGLDTDMTESVALAGSLDMVWSVLKK